VSPLSRETYWKAIVADFQQSGLTHVQFCQLRDISLHCFRSWLYRLRHRLQPPRPTRRANSPTPVLTPSDPPAFLPVHVRPGPAGASRDQQAIQPAATLELVLRDQCHLRVPVGFDPATLHQLLDVLEERL
jgi:hypothetical protein